MKLKKKLIMFLQKIKFLLFNKENLLNKNNVQSEEKKNLEQFKSYIDEINKFKNEEKDKDKLYTLINDYLQQFSCENNNFLYSLLNEIDKVYANFYHKNDIRRIINAISFYFAYDKKNQIMSKKKHIL